MSDHGVPTVSSGLIWSMKRSLIIGFVVPNRDATGAVNGLLGSGIRLLAEAPGRLDAAVREQWRAYVTERARREQLEVAVAKLGERQAGLSAGAPAGVMSSTASGAD